MLHRYVGYFPGPYPNAGVLPFAGTVSLEALRAQWSEFLGASDSPDTVGLYVHLPHCPWRCTYCDCSGAQLDGRSDLEATVANLVAEMDYLRDTFTPVRFSRLYIGGGTPNLLSADQLARLVSAIDVRFEFAPGALRCIELAPELPTHLDTLARAGFNRLSFGVQSRDAAILRTVERPSSATTLERVADALQRARKRGFAEINVDLIFGVADESTESFHRGLLEVLDWHPDTVTAKLINDSELARVYRSAEHERAVAQRFVDYCDGRYRSIEGERPAYRCHTRPRAIVVVHRDLPRDWTEHLDFYSSQDRVTVSTLGLGRWAQSKMHGACHYQNNSDGHFDPKASCYEARPYTLELEATMDAACDLMSFGEHDLSTLARRYGSVPRSLLEEVARLSGTLSVDGQKISCTPGPENPLLPLIDRLSAGTSDAQGVTISFELSGAHWSVRIEPLRGDRSYYAAVNDLGVYYGNHDREADTRAIGVVMDQLCAHLHAIEAAALEDHATELRSLVLATAERLGG